MANPRRFMSVLLLLSYTSLLSECKPAPDCLCKKAQFACDSIPNAKCTCIPKDWRCDGDYDCPGGSDERGCVLPKCDPGSFQCSSGKCIKEKWKCDGKDDCLDGEDEDEENCPHVPCDEETQKECKTGRCINSSWWCDGDEDCPDGDDETSCGYHLNCTTEEFTCSNGKCLPKRLRCDGFFDCADGLDEEECGPHGIIIPGNRTCNPQEFFCEASDGGEETCIPKEYVCDGEADCDSGIDEADPHCRLPCTPEEYSCANGQCVYLHDYCDGFDDCGDGSDEVDCQPPKECLDGEFRCQDGLCISKKWRCDGDSECKDGSDEDGCPALGSTCDNEQFQCVTSKRCIQSGWRCDKEEDCHDGSDEENCKCEAGQYLCRSGQCIGAGKVCNGIPDCIDGSDEKPIHNCYNLIPGANFTSCADNNGGCEHTCRVTSSGRLECICNKGYRIADDLRSCVDIDECTIEGRCSQTCNNSIGGFECSCLPGYILRPDKRTCKASGPAPALLFTNKIDIRRMVPDRLEPKPVLQDLENAIGIDYHIERGLMFWSDVTLDRIMRSNVNGSGVQEVVSSGLESPSGVAVDWIHDLLYWTDSRTSRIEVSQLDGSNRKVLVWDKLEKPRALALHPLKSLMFWTDWGDTPRLESAAMDGSMRRSLASRNVHWPNGLTIDYTNNHIYWSDAKYHIIETANLDGGDRRAVISRGLQHPFGITIFEDKVYWTDWETRSVNSANKFTGNGFRIIQNRLYFPMDIRTYHPLRQPKGKNQCLMNTCSHLCLPKPDGYTCACPTGFRRTNTTHCAEDIETFLVFTRKDDVRRISFDGKERADIVLPLENIKNALALDWDGGHPGYIYWSDVTLDIISRSEWDGSNQKVLISSSSDSPAGLAIDWITNKMYWTDAGINRIEVAMLDGSMRCVLVWTDLDRPRAIVVHPKTGHIFWTDWGSDPRIERAGMNGLNRSIIVSSSVKWPNGLSIDYVTERLYWVDAGTQQIESSDFNGKSRRVIIDKDLPHPFSITMDAEKIYWTDWKSKSISFADKESGEHRGVLRKELSYLMDIRYYHNSRPISPNPCSLQNGHCSHLCLLASNPNPSNTTKTTPYSCACPTGLTLGNDGKTCNTEMKKFLAISRRSDIRVVSLDVPYSADVKLSIDTYMNNVVDVAVDPVDGYIYWSDIGSRKICRSLLNNSSQEETFIGFGLVTVEGLAIDSVGRMLYYTDDGRDSISVARLDGKYKRVLINENLDSPRAIVLHYETGYMYWTDWGINPKIERAGMDGSDRSVIISSRIQWPNGITIAYKENLLIWADAQHEKIESSDLLGNNRKLLSSVPHPYSLASLDGYIYWNDWRTHNIVRLNLQNTTDVKTIRENMPSMMGIKAVSMNTTGQNRCGPDNGGCSHLCLRSPSADIGYKCACPTGVRLQSDGRTCSNIPSEYLLFTSRLSIRRVSLEADPTTYVELPIGNLENAIALDYHYGLQYLFFTDVYLDVIMRSNLDGSNVTTIASRNLKTMDGIAVDWVANNLYWTDTGPNTISVSRLDGGNRKVIVNRGMDEPRALSVDPARGYLFWTDWGSKARIEKVYLDGSGRKVLVKKNLQWPNGLTLDYVNSRIYWVDAHHLFNRIESCDYNGRKRRIVVSFVAHGFAITYLANTLYWTDWQTQNIHSIRLPVKSAKSQSIIKGIEGLMDIKAVSSSRQTGTNRCDAKSGYGRCTHLCFMRGSKNYVCACPDPTADLKGSSTSFNITQYYKSINCSLYPVYPKIIPTTMTPTYADSEDVTSTTFGGTSLKQNDDTKFIIHVVGAFLGAALAAFFVFFAIGFLLWRHMKQKSASSTVTRDGGVVSFRNLTYSATSSLISSNNTPLRTPTPNEEPDNDATENLEEKSLLMKKDVSKTNNVISVPKKCDSIRLSDVMNDYSQIPTLEASPLKSTSFKSKDSDGVVVSSFGKESGNSTLSRNQSLPDIPSAPDEYYTHEYQSINGSDNDIYAKVTEDLSESSPSSNNRQMRHLMDKQPKVSVTTTCTMLSEDDEFTKADDNYKCSDDRGLADGDECSNRTIIEGVA